MYCASRLKILVESVTILRISNLDEADDSLVIAHKWNGLIGNQR